MSKKRYLLGLLIIILVSIVIGVWLANRDNVSNHRSENNIDDINKSAELCSKAATSYVGLTESKANDKAQKTNRDYRVTSRDGESLPVTMDYSSGRLNFEIQNGVVAKATCG